MPWRSGMKKVCSQEGCGTLLPADGASRCPIHAQGRRPSTRATRNVTAQALARAGGRCERCGTRAPKLVRHHVEKGSEDPAHSLALCPACHHAVDPHAPRTPDLTGRPKR